MDWIRAWVLQVAGVIVLGAVCDLIMPEGNMKKYVKPILGLVLIFTIIRPIAALSVERLPMEALQDSVGSSFELSRRVEEKQQQHIAEIYEKSLADKIEEIIRQKYGLDAVADVSADKKADRIGNIEGVVLEISVKNGEIVNTEGVKKYLAEQLGIKAEAVAAVLRERGEE